MRTDVPLLLVKNLHAVRGEQKSVDVEIIFTPFGAQMEFDFIKLLVVGYGQILQIKYREVVITNIDVHSLLLDVPEVAQNAIEHDMRLHDTPQKLLCVPALSVKLPKLVGELVEVFNVFVAANFLDGHLDSGLSTLNEIVDLLAMLHFLKQFVVIAAIFFYFVVELAHGLDQFRVIFAVKPIQKYIWNGMQKQLLRLLLLILLQLHQHSNLDLCAFDSLVRPMNKMQELLVLHLRIFKQLVGVKELVDLQGALDLLLVLEQSIDELILALCFFDEFSGYFLAYLKLDVEFLLDGIVFLVA